MRSLNKSNIPPWCLVTEEGKLMGPQFKWVDVPDGCWDNLAISWDGIACRAEYYFWEFGQVYRFNGPKLPDFSDQWHLEPYSPALELQIAIVNLAGAGVMFGEILRRVNRPRAEVCAILGFHGYLGWCHYIHRHMDETILKGHVLTVDKSGGEKGVRNHEKRPQAMGLGVGPFKVVPWESSLRHTAVTFPPGRCVSVVGAVTR